MICYLKLNNRPPWKKNLSWRILLDKYSSSFSSFVCVSVCVWVASVCWGGMESFDGLRVALLDKKAYEKANQLNSC